MNGFPSRPLSERLARWNRIAFHRSLSPATGSALPADRGTLGTGNALTHPRFAVHGKAREQFSICHLASRFRGRRVRARHLSSPLPTLGGDRVRVRGLHGHGEVIFSVAGG